MHLLTLIQLILLICHVQILSTDSRQKTLISRQCTLTSHPTTSQRNETSKRYDLCWQRRPLNCCLSKQYFSRIFMHSCIYDCVLYHQVEVEEAKTCNRQNLHNSIKNRIKINPQFMPFSLCLNCLISSTP